MVIEWNVNIPALRANTPFTTEPLMRIGLSCAAFCVVTFFVTAQDKKKDAYVSPDGSYKVAFPGAPKVTEQKQETKVGDIKITNAVWRSADDTQYLSVSVTVLPFPKERYDPKRGLDGAAKGGGGAGFKVTETKEITFGKAKHPGRDVMSVNETKNLTCRGLIVLDHDKMRLYQVTVIGGKEFVTGKDATAFVSSFEITGK